MTWGVSNTRWRSVRSWVEGEESDSRQHHRKTKVGPPLIIISGLFNDIVWTVEDVYSHANGESVAVLNKTILVCFKGISCILPGRQNPQKFCLPGVYSKRIPSEIYPSFYYWRKSDMNNGDDINLLLLHCYNHHYQCLKFKYVRRENASHISKYCSKNILTWWRLEKNIFLFHRWDSVWNLD